jgi:hypothetical protein
MAVVINFSLDPDADKDIIRFYEEQSNRSAKFREVTRFYLAREEGITLADVRADILAEIRTLPSRLKMVATVPEEDQIDGDEPEEAARNLNDLLPRLDGGAID